ncbi:hypothetical protein MPH_06313 [Macrophomina phaseolina MS6]|uniref:Peroxisomal biogenesis factor 11 n=1 Tax=Macrophomina phaseolina (strain MS6) TaxID=1126212 RepID=K2RV36_MACPH|nr:hypothetical protein MPH_06313 [Macrophomina phaseolina MS6]
MTRASRWELWSFFNPTGLGLPDALMCASCVTFHPIFIIPRSSTPPFLRLQGPTPPAARRLTDYPFHTMSSPEGGRPPALRRQQLRALLQSSLRSTDTTLLRLAKLLSTPSGIDSTLCTINYTLTLVRAGLQKHLDSKLRRLALGIAEKASDALLPGETLIASVPPTPAIRRLSRTVDGSKKLEGLISDFRIFVRMWGLLDLYLWGRDTYANPPKDAVVKSITWLQVVVNVLFQYMENVAYLASKGILNSDGWSGEAGAKRQTWWWVWSSRFWAAHVGLEFARLGYEWRRDSKQAAAEGEEKEEKLERRKKYETWWRQAISNAGWAPLTIHWSLEEGCLSDPLVGFFGMVAGGVGLRERWRQAAA